MASITWDIAMVTKCRWDIITNSTLISRVTTLCHDIVNNKFSGTVETGARYQPDFIHLRVTMDEMYSVQNLIRRIKGHVSFNLQNENADIKEDIYGKAMFERDSFCSSSLPPNSEIDDWVNDRLDLIRP